MTLVSDSEMAALRGLAESGMVTTVAIYHGGPQQTQDGNVWGYPETADLTVSGWLYQPPAPGRPIDVISGEAGALNVYRLMLPFGTDCRSGDKVVVAGASYTVEQTNSASTYQPSLTCWLRIIE